jgi:hypothetical protein
MKSKSKNCSGKHWEVIEGRLFLTTDTEKEQELAKQVINVLETQIREHIYNQICDFKPLENRRQIMKLAGSMDNALLAIQAICADIALGKGNDGTDARKNV